MGAGLLLAACPLPDRDINVITEDVNNAPVRLIEPVGLSPSQRCECDPFASGCDPEKPEEDFEAECPLPQVIGIPHFIDPADQENDYQFCKCADGEVDQGALSALQFFAEDQDKTPDVNEAADSLYAAILLNAKPEKNPAAYVAYEAYRPPTDPLPSAAGDGYDPIGRPRPYVRTIYVGDADSRWDLCNGADAKPGFNTFTVLVTDREWNEVVNPDGKPVEEPGVVDVANGATYDLSTYTFYCGSEADEGDPFGCAEQCMEPTGG